MMSQAKAHGGPGLRRGERAGFFLIFAVAFVLFLMAAIVDRLLPRPWRLLPQGRDGRKSILGQATEAAQTTTTFAFMG